MPYRTQSRDTSVAAEKVQFAYLRRIGRKARFENGLARIDQSLFYMWSAFERRYPDASLGQLQTEWVRVQFGDELARKIEGSARMQNIPTNHDAIREAMIPVVKLLNQNGIAYAVVGSVAALSHGYGRSTIDVDVLAKLDMPAVPIKQISEAFEQTLSADYYVDAASIRDAIRHRSSFNLVHHATGIKIDVFVSRNQPFDEQVLERRQLETRNDNVEPAFFVQSAEDLVLSKLIWFKKGYGVSDHQWNDILAVLKVQLLAIDTDYLQKWASELGIDELLEKALDEAGFQELD